MATYRGYNIMAKKLKFVNKTHQYSYDGTVLESVTTFISKYMEPFDAHKIATIKAIQAKRKGIKGQGIRYWKQKWKQVAKNGTLVHKLIENYVLNKPNTFPHDFETRNKYLAGLKFIDVYTKTIKEPVLNPEVKVFDVENLLAGTIDLVVEKDGEGTERVVDLIDWKTNEKISTVGYKNAMCLPPIEDLPDCSMTKYSLQLNIYKYLLEKKGTKVDKMYLVNVRDDTSYITHEIQDMQDIVRRLLK